MDGTEDETDPTGSRGRDNEKERVVEKGRVDE